VSTGHLLTAGEQLALAEKTGNANIKHHIFVVFFLLYEIKEVWKWN